MKPESEFLDREKTFEVALADGDDGAGSAVVKMAPVETRDPYGDMLMSGAFDKQKGATIPGAARSQHDHAAARKGRVRRREGPGSFIGTLEFNETNRARRSGGRPRRPALSRPVRPLPSVQDEDVEQVEIGKGRSGFNIKKAVLREVSLTGLGAMPGTGLSRVKADGPEDSADDPAIPFPRSLAATDLSHRSL